MVEKTALGKNIIGAIDQFDAINDTVTGFAKASATQSIDLFEKAFAGALELQGQLAKASKISWLAEATESNQALVKSFAGTATANARTLLK